MTRTTLVGGLALVAWMVAFTVACPASAQADQPVEQGDDSAPSPDAPWPDSIGNAPPFYTGPPPRSGPPPPVDDPRVGVGFGLIGAGAFFLAGGLSIFADAQTSSGGSLCGPTGCQSYDRKSNNPEGESPGVAMTAGGVATALFGVAVLAHGLGDSKPLAPQSSRKLAAGMALTGFGFGTTIGASVVLMHDAIEGSDLGFVGLAMFVPAAGLLATGLPLWITGSRPPDSVAEHRNGKDGKTQEVMRSPTMGSIGVGMAVVGLGVVGAGIGAAVEGSRREDEDLKGLSYDYGFATRPNTTLTILSTTTAGVALFSLGLPLAIIGLSPTSATQAHASTPGLSLPTIDIGSSGASATWRY